MMAMISPALEAFSESLSTLKFANRAKNIKNEARVNEDLDQQSLLRRRVIYAWMRGCARWRTGGAHCVAIYWPSHPASVAVAWRRACLVMTNDDDNDDDDDDEDDDYDDADDDDDGGDADDGGRWPWR